MTAFADLVEKHCKPRKPSGPNRANHQALIATMPNATTGEQFTRADVVRFTGLDESVISLTLREMARVNTVSETVIDDKGTIGFRFMPKGVLRRKWRKRPNLLADCPYSPRYF